MNLEDFLKNYLKVSGNKHSIVSYKDDKELKEIIDKFLKKNKSKIAMKACFSNAATMMKADSRIAYCEGYTSIKIGDDSLPVEHAWNSFGKIHFDITSELLFDGDLGKGSNEYIELYKTFDSIEARKVANGVVRPYLRRSRVQND